MSNTSTPLANLNSDLQDLSKDINYFATPLSDVHDALGKLEQIEKTPKHMKDHVHEIHSVLKDVRGPATPLHGSP